MIHFCEKAAQKPDRSSNSTAAATQVPAWNGHAKGDTEIPKVYGTIDT